MRVDATRILPKLYQGGAPSSAQTLARSGFETVVFCAAEIQPPEQALLGYVEPLYCPLIDNPMVPLSRRDFVRALDTARQVSSRVSSGRRVLVTCAMGRNRSGLVTAMAVHLLTGKSGEDAARHVQILRPNALSNPQFVQALRRFRAG